MSISLNLYRLQIIDSQIINCKKRIEAIEKELEDNKEINETLMNLESSKQKAHKLNHEVNEIQHLITEKKIKIEQSEAALYDGKERNPKILQDLQSEISLLKKQINDLENEMIEKMIEEEKNQQELEQLKANFHLLEIKNNQLRSVLITEKDCLSQKIEHLQVERETFLTQISADHLEEYNRLAASKQGIAVATIQENSCSVCGTTFTPAQCQVARSQSKFFYCPTCHRIIYGD